MFVAGLIAGNRKLFGLWVPEEDFHAEHFFRESVGALCRMAIFIVLGTHVDLATLGQYWLPSLLVVLVLMFVARPLVVLICTLFIERLNGNLKINYL